MGNQPATRRSMRGDNAVGTPVDASDMPDGRMIAMSASSSVSSRATTSGGHVVSTEESYRYSESRTEGGSVVQRSYSFTVRERCLSGPPQSFRQRRRSLYNYLGMRLGGNFAYEPEHMITAGREEHDPVCTLTKQTVEVLKRAFEDVDPTEIVDYHVHLVGHGDSGSGCHMHHSVKQWWRPFTYLKTHVFMSAAQVPDMDGGDIQYISRLIRLAKHFVPSCVFNPSQHGYKYGKYCLLPFDEFYHKNGQADRTKTTMFVPNDYSFTLSSEFPDMFLPFGSVNPYRLDALEELERCARNGVTVIKWLPNSMGINPSDKQCVPFYDKMRELDMALLIHVGEEHTVTAAFIDNRLGNPLYMRKPLDRGVKVIAAHCATEGYAVDLDRNNESVPCFDLFMRLMEEEKYKDLLFGDISAVCGFKRVAYLQRLLQSTHVHHRLVFGTDYPVPAINLVVHTSKLQRYGMITAEECTALNELYNYNPLLFDFVCKRLIKGPNGETFPPALFKAHPLLPPHRNQSSNEEHVVPCSDQDTTTGPEETGHVAEQLQDGDITADVCSKRESSVDVTDGILPAAVVEEKSDTPV